MVPPDSSSDGVLSSPPRMAATRIALGLAPAALLAGALGVAAALWTLLEGAERVGETLHGVEHAHVALAAAFVQLAFATLTAAWLYLGRAVNELWLPRSSTRRGAALRGLGVSLLLLAPPGYALAYSLTYGTSAFRPGRSEWQLALGVIAAAPLVLLALGLARRGVLRVRARSPRVTLGACVALMMVAFAIWFFATASLRERYGVSQLLSFGLLTAAATLIFSVLFTADRRPAFDARAAALLGAGVLASAIALLAPASPAVLAHFHAERPSRWFARALTPALPDGDRDGVPRNVGLVRGGDCDDADPKRHPFTRDVPGNGVDENCFHGDVAVNPPPPALPVAGARAPATPKNVVLVVIDSLRFDRRFENGINPSITPALARLTARSTTFSAFRTCSPRTRESVPDLLGAAPELSRGIPAETPSAIQALSRAGVHTAFIASEWLARYASPPGFELARLSPSRYGHFADAEVAAEVRAFLRERHRRPFFLFTHWLGAHEPYAGDPACLARATSDRERYDCSLILLDRELDALLASLVEAGIHERTAVAVTADHGEEFGEHGGRFHATTLYDEILRVPLVMHVPGRSAELVGVPVGCGDLLPTLLRLSGHQPGLTAYGEDVLASERSRPQVARTRRPGAALFEPRAHAVVLHGHKLLFDAASGVLSYFDLARDPFEQRPLASVAPDIQRELLEAMDGWLSAQAPTSPLERTPAVAAR
jgi:hypothetical protein